MIVSLYFAVFIMVWFFGSGLLLLKFPAQCCRLRSWGKAPDEKQVRRTVIVGYIALFFGCIFLIEIVFGFVKLTK